ncbi:uncharacterized protein LOC114251374 [Bombyx mandarina]|uniref:Uncharacterized protein LOC114251374 n=1 Tax=Bombyx mandarina TaxID=7092 RepID=A0A6J2KHA0_BOMMA|nr:uncharacterized protein LOC114251374 [Bombyx mandarina]
MTTVQDCPEEISHSGISVKWKQSSLADHIESDPQCYRNQNLITRNCTDNVWKPPLEAVEPCLKVVKNFDVFSCPPGFHKISEKNNDYCYQIGQPSQWDYPCFSSGAASVISDLSELELNSLLQSLVSMNISRYFWLPGKRHKLFNPAVWNIPGPNWGRRVKSNSYLRYRTIFLKNCLLLDVQQRVIITETCSNIYPSLCFYINEFYHPSKCPDGYYALRFQLDNGTCFGIESSDSINGWTFDEFITAKCKNPMNVSSLNALSRFMFKKIAELSKLPNEIWCWLKFTSYYMASKNNTFLEDLEEHNLEGIIDNAGTLGLMNKSRHLSCMACETQVIYLETELMFEYNTVDNNLYLTIYYPSGLWKYNKTDKGVQCFSDANGFVGVINVRELDLFQSKQIISESIASNKVINGNAVEKVIYVINLVTDRSAQYWCEGHTTNFTLISTNKIVVNPRGNDVHVFSVTVEYLILNEIEDETELNSVILLLTTIFNANKVLLMDILGYNKNSILMLFHIHVVLEDTHEDYGLNIIEKLNFIKNQANLHLPQHNLTVLNISSSLYCLPTTSSDTIMLDWDLTSIGQISAPKQFCLQSNGLPVKRRCLGSYLYGSNWGSIDGICDTAYKPSTTTQFLYNFLKGQEPNYTSRFITDGLNFVLNDTDIIIPADIYYLSMSLRQVLQISHEQEIFIDMGYIENIVWAMDRMMTLDCEYLRLAQTLNSTNVILSSVNYIIENIAYNNLTLHRNILENENYQIAVKPNFLVQISFPELNNITGIALSKNTESDSFNDMKIIPLYKNTTLDYVQSIVNLEVATWVPENVINTLIPNSNGSVQNYTNKKDINIILSLFHTDAVFPEVNFKEHAINSRIVGVTIPGFISNLEYPVPLIFREFNESSSNKFCGYWDFKPHGPFNNNPGAWKNEGCYLIRSEDKLTVCECYHLTHFGQLLHISDYNFPSNNKIHKRALNIITLIGCFLSLGGIAGIWITALIFGNWRKKPGTKVLLQLSTSIAFPLLFMVVYDLDNTIFITENDEHFVDEDYRTVCTVLGAILHYSILSSFLWMLIAAVLQFVRYVRVLGIRRSPTFMIKISIAGWGVPIIPVTITLIIDPSNYIPAPSQTREICYPQGFALIFGIIMPVGVILIINVILFILVLHAISRNSDEGTKNMDMDLVGAQLRLSVFLFFLLGLTWVFGILSFSKNLLWSYLFCLTSTLQGFVLFIYFIICDPVTRKMWVALVKSPASRGNTRNSITSLSVT